jgi:hypothetical protein
MKYVQKILLATLGFLVASCSSTGLVVEKYDSKTGVYEKRVYTKFYNASEWVEEGKLGLEVWVDHEKKVIPVVHQAQQALGLLGPGDVEASGLVTLYFVNLDTNDKVVHVTGITSSSPRSGVTLELPIQTQLKSRSHTQLVVGRVPISNYGTYIDVVIEFSVNGVKHSRKLTAKRLTEIEMAQYSGRDGHPPYPWFSSPYYPFNPPLTQHY